MLVSTCAAVWAVLVYITEVVNCCLIVHFIDYCKNSHLFQVLSCVLLLNIYRQSVTLICTGSNCVSTLLQELSHFPQFYWALFYYATHNYGYHIQCTGGYCIQCRFIVAGFFIYLQSHLLLYCIAMFITMIQCIILTCIVV